MSVIKGQVLGIEADTPEWHAYRQTRFSASRVAGILGAQGAFHTELSIWSRMQGLTEDDAKGPQLEYGLRMEEPAAQWWSDTTGLSLTPSPGLVRHPEVDWLCATPDRIIPAQKSHEDGAWEGKTASAFKKEYWEYGIPEAYMVQIQMQLACTGLQWASCGVIIAPDFKWMHIERNQSFIDATLELLDAWRRKHIINGIQPTATRDDRKLLAKMHPNDNGKLVVLPNSLCLKSERDADLSSDIKTMTEERAGIRAEVSQIMGSNTYAEVGDRDYWSYKTNKAGNRVLKRVKNAKGASPGELVHTVEIPQ
jgi:putative phage-type endonuclease